jgi:hypothetical protein
MSRGIFDLKSVIEMHLLFHPLLGRVKERAFWKILKVS